MQCIINNKVVSYSRMGSGNLVLLLHGWGSDSKSLSSIAQKLSHNYDVLAVDLPGFGGSEKPDKAWGLEDYTKWLKVFLQKIGNPKIYALLGHSNGGAIAIKYASQGNYLEKLILLGSSGIRGEEKGKNILLKIMSKLGKTLTIILPKGIRTTLRNRWYKLIGSEMYDNPDMNGTFKKIVSEDLSKEALMVSVPTLLIYGDRDKSTPVKFGLKYSNLINGSKLEVIKGAGHYAHLDKPEETISLIEGFIK